MVFILPLKVVLFVFHSGRFSKFGYSPAIIDCDGLIVIDFRLVHLSTLRSIGGGSNRSVGASLLSPEHLAGFWEGGWDSGHPEASD